MWLVFQQQEPDNYMLRHQPDDAISRTLSKSHSARSISKSIGEEGVEERGIDASNGKTLIERNPAISAQPRLMCSLAIPEGFEGDRRTAPILDAAVGSVAKPLSRALSAYSAFGVVASRAPPAKTFYGALKLINGWNIGGTRTLCCIRLHRIGR